MKRIESLTPEQEAYLPEFRRKWFEIGTCTEPADRPRAEAAITKMYALRGKPRPSFFWFDGLMTSELFLSLGASLRASLWESLGASLRASLRASLGASLRASLRASLEESLGASLEESLGASLEESLRASLEESLGASLWESLGASLEESLGASLEESLEEKKPGGESAGEIEFVPTYMWAQMEAYWICHFLFCAKIGVPYSPKDSEILNLWAEIAQSSCWWWPYENVCVVSERPEEIHMEPVPGQDFRFRLHRDGGPSIRFRDGWAIWNLWGVRVSREIAETPAEQLDPKLVVTERNVEVRSVIIRKIGAERIAEKLGAPVTHI